jgi:hypothetical protein
LLRKVSLGTQGDAFEQTRKFGAGSALGGIWVSRHFTFLAERAQTQHPTEKGFTEFLQQQQLLQRHWSREITKERGPADAHSLIESGFRWVQFFDWLSLWLCCQARTETESFALPTGETMHFTPLKSGEIAVEPFPFPVPVLELEMDAKRLPEKTFPDRLAFQSAFDESQAESLNWKLVRW